MSISTVTGKRHWAQARADANDFYHLFPRSTFERWSGAGSLRRQLASVGDVDHVVIPLDGEVPGDDLFGGTRRVNLLWHRLDELVKAGVVAKAVDAAGRTCWGDVQRRASFRGFTHDVYLAEPDNWGAVLAVRTGPAELSKRLVLGLQYRGYMSGGGFHVVNKSDCFCPCGWAGAEPEWRPIAEALAEWRGVRWRRAPGEDAERAARCPKCGDPMGLEMRRVPAPDERTYFALAGVPWAEPEDRR